MKTTYSNLLNDCTLKIETNHFFSIISSSAIWVKKHLNDFSMNFIMKILIKWYGNQFLHWFLIKKQKQNQLRKNMKRDTQNLQRPNVTFLWWNISVKRPRKKWNLDLTRCYKCFNYIKIESNYIIKNILKINWIDMTISSYK